MRYMLTLAMLVLPAYAMAAPDVKIGIKAEKVVVVEKDGKKVEKLVAVDEVAPGDVLAYTLTYENKGDETATNVKLVDPIPDTTTYLVGSVFGPGADVGFSIDGGKTFKAPSLLLYKVKVGDEVVSKKASPEQYTHIRWTVKEIPAGKSGIAGFRVRVK
jgi:uncharacterized repeat protein (TIGR01451 family)